MNNKLAVIFILMTVVIDSIGIGLIMPVTPDLIRELLNADLSDAALWGGALSASFAVMQFLFGATIGGMSDRFGRRPVLLVSLFIVGIDYVIMGLTQSIWIMLLGRVIGGIASATHSTANAYMADISAPDKKAANFGMIGAAFGVGFVLGPMLGGLLSEFGSRMPFFAAAVLAFSNCIFGFFVLPETVTKDKQRALNFRRLNPFGALKHVGKLPNMGPLLAMYFFHQVAFFVYPSTWTYFTLERFSWTAREVGFSLAAFGIGIAVVQGGVIRLVLPRLGEAKTVTLGFVLAVIAFVAFAFLTQGWMVYLLLPISTLAMVAQPALQGIMSKAADDNAQGELQGVLSSVAAIATIISPLMMTGMFSYFTRVTAPIYAPGAPFLFAAILDMIALAIFIWAMRRSV